jgi:hypothetical protein
MCGINRSHYIGNSANIQSNEAEIHSELKTFRFTDIARFLS